MGWTDWIVKFEDKNEIFIDWNNFADFLKKYGTLTLTSSSNNVYELNMKNPIGATVLIHGTPNTGVSAISINKPIENEFIRPFIFDALKRFDMILCDENFYGDIQTKT